jgi:hypothetical protein
MVDIAVDFSKREGYQLQPAKSVILQVKSKIKTIVTNEGFWKIDNRIMPVVDKVAHIGITRSDTNSGNLLQCPPSSVYPMGCKLSKQHHLRRSEHRH